MLLRTLSPALLVCALACSSPQPAAQAPLVPQESTPAPESPAIEPELVLPSEAPNPADVHAPQGKPAGAEPVRIGDPQSLAYAAEFFPGAKYDPDIPAPRSVLGVDVGTRPAHHAEVAALWRLWAAKSPRVQLEVTGATWEGRELFANVVTSPKNVANMAQIRANIAKLADPRELKPGELEALAASTPAIAWMGYSIHGDEMSGVDGGLALAYYLIAATNPDVLQLLDEVVVVFDPMLNPDGRERFLAMLAQTAGAMPNLDSDSMQRGGWPYGRGNHYLFDMNRDWMPGIAPETRARWKAAGGWHPQVLVDAHEMGGLDTYLFYPPREPINRNLPGPVRSWWQVFAGDQARAFDRYGWSYYTREWAEYWYPGYSDSWGSLSGAVGILYEQAGLGGQPLRRRAGEIQTYRESAHHQAVSSLANLETLAKNREAVLREYGEAKLANCDPKVAGNERSFVIVPGRHPERESYLVETLAEQGIEVYLASKVLPARDAASSTGGTEATKELPAGAIVVPAAQPMGSLLRAYLEFDPRMNKQELFEERKELELKGESRIYDSTAWNLAHALDLDAYWCTLDSTPEQRVTTLTETDGAVVGTAGYGWVVDGESDRAVVFAAHALELGLEVNYAEKPFTAEGRKFARGSLLVRRSENGGTGEAATDAALGKVATAAQAAGVLAFAVSTARSPDEGPDLGAPRFRLLARPRVGLVSNTPISPDGFGHVWHQIDRVLGLPASMLDAQSLGAYDLRRYNVIVVPPSYGISGQIAPIAKDLETWVRSGGTLIAMGSSASALCGKDLGLSSVRRRADVLDKLPEWQFASKREAASRKIEVDEEALWNPKPAPKAEEKPADEKATGDKSTDEKKKDDKPADAGKLADPDAARQEAWLERFSPQGVTLRGQVDTEHWITAGCADELPVFFDGSLVLYSRTPVQTAVRLAPGDRLRLGGLLWPEARERIEGSAYLTVERLGRGQVILFAAQPGFRGYQKATGRLLSNAVVYGPGLGADQPSDW